MSEAAAEQAAALVDTDVATWLILDAPHAAPWRPVLRGRVLVISFATFGELMAFPYVKRWGERRTQEWEATIRRTFVVLPYNANVALIWAPMHAKLSGHLQAKGTNDLWTAATALASDPQLAIATNNRGDFDQIADEFDVSLLSPAADE